MKTPPFLLGAALLFWGLQTDLLWAGAVIAIVIEGARWTPRRWELSEDDFSRIWTFCTVLLLAIFAYAFTANQGPSDFFGWLQNPSSVRQRNVGTTSGRTAAMVIRWLPMIFFPFLAAQVFSTREGIPLETISLILRRRWKRARKAGLPVPATKTVNVAYPYLALCLVAASAHPSENTTFFWGLCAVLVATLWPLRSPRVAAPVWISALLLSIAMGYSAQRGIGQFQHWLESYNPRWFARFAKRVVDPTRGKTAIGQVGQIQTSGQIILRLEARRGPVPALLREACYRAFRGQSWYAETTEKDFNDVGSHPDGTTWSLLSDKANASVLNIACYLDGGTGLLPLPKGSSLLENLPAFEVKTNDLGAVLAKGPGLILFDAHYGSGQTLDGPPDTHRHGDLDVPPSECSALDEVISELHLREQNLDQTLRTLQTFFQGRFRYTTWQQSPRSYTNGTPLARFLLHTRRGHCEYFATATVLLLQRLGIPARYAVGYAVHEGSGRKYVARLRDAHAWCLVWDEQRGAWQDFDSTPASWIEAEAEHASPLQFLSDCWSRIMFELSKVRWGQTHLRQYILWGLVPVLAFLLYQIIFRQRRRHQPRKQSGDLAAAWPGLDSEFYQLESRLARLGVARQTGQSLSEWISETSADPALAPVRDALGQSLRLHYRYRFDPQGLSSDEREALRLQTQDCLARLESHENKRTLGN